MLAFSLTGHWLDLPAGTDEPDADRLLADLAALGWSGARLVEAATLRRTVPVEALRSLGPARFAAVATELQRRVIAEAAEVRRVSGRDLTADERRLATDRPPHWC